jgi:hypothetical protein
MHWTGSLLLVLLVVLIPTPYVSAQVAGSTSLGETAEERWAVVLGWSAKKQIQVLEVGVRDGLVRESCPVKIIS